MDEFTLTAPWVHPTVLVPLRENGALAHLHLVSKTAGASEYTMIGEPTNWI